MGKRLHGQKGSVQRGLRVDALALQGFQKTGLGERVANMFVAACGKSTLGLAYGLSIAEAFLAPAMPSTTARAGGIFMPIINSLALASGSEPGLAQPFPSLYYDADADTACDITWVRMLWYMRFWVMRGSSDL